MTDPLCSACGEPMVAHYHGGECPMFTCASPESEAITALRAEVERLREALEQIAAEAFVPLGRLPEADQPNGWRDVAIERIDIARATLKGNSNV